MTIPHSLKIARRETGLRRKCFALALAGAISLAPASGLAQTSSLAAWDFDALAPGIAAAPLRLEGEGQRFEFSPRARAKIKTSMRPAPRPVLHDVMVTDAEPDEGEKMDATAEVADIAADLPVTEIETEIEDLAAPSGELANNKKEVLPVPAEVALSLAPLRTGDIVTAEFPRLRRESLTAISQAGATAEHYLEHARTLLGGMFLPEAYHALEVARSSPGGTQPSVLARIGEIEAAIEGLEGPGSGAAPDANGALWSVLQDHARGNSASNPGIRAAAADFANQSGAIVNAALPLVLRAAIAAGDAEIAADLIEIGVATGDLAGSQRRLLEGRLASLTGDDEAAFDHYAAAMASMDAAGIEARIALFDLAMEQNKAETFPQLREILTQGIAQWRNDDLARQLMVRLAAVTEDIGDRAAALSVMSMLMVEYPDSGEAELARRRVPLLLSQLAAQARDKEIALEAYIVTLRDLHASLRNDLHWVAARRELAEILAAEGLLLAAAAEYEAIEDDIAAGSPIADRMEGDVTLRKAELLMQAGLLAEARTALAGQSGHRLPGIAARHAELTVQLDALSRSPVAAAADGEFIEPRVAMARSAALSGRPDEAVRLYAEHIVGDNDLSPSDVSRYILATAEAGQIAQMDLARSGAEDAKGESMLAAAASIAQPREPLAPLSGTGAKDVLSRSGEALDAVAVILGKKPGLTAE